MSSIGEHGVENFASQVRRDQKVKERESKFANTDLESKT
jgi:hypothetical protein